MNDPVNTVIDRPRLTLLQRLRLAADAEDWSKVALVRFASERIAPNALLLDAGAGDCVYRRWFPHVRYESCDLFASAKVQHTFLCDVQQMNIDSDRYDALICIQVLDDLPDPQKAINEFFRVLKPGGQLFLIAPFFARVHGEPYHFFHFSRNGIELMATRAGFETLAITPRGGVFSCLSYILRKLPTYLSQQWRSIGARNSIVRWVCAKLGLLFLLITAPFCWFLLPWACFLLDSLDQQRAFTLGYRYHGRKPSVGGSGK